MDDQDGEGTLFYAVKCFHVTSFPMSTHFSLQGTNQTLTIKYAIEHPSNEKLEFTEKFDNQ